MKATEKSLWKSEDVRGPSDRWRIQIAQRTSQLLCKHRYSAFRCRKHLDIERLFCYTRPMGYKTTATTNTVHLVALHDLSTEIQSRCAMLRQEAGQCWTDLVRAHVAKRQSGVWLSEADLKQISKGRYALHSQSV